MGNGEHAELTGLKRKWNSFVSELESESRYRFVFLLDLTDYGR